MKHLIFILLSLFLLTECTQNEIEEFEIGIIADCQYCNCPTRGVRHYSESAGRLQEAVVNLNEYELDYTIHLGDFIDKDFQSFDTVLPIWNQLHSEKYHVLGNHEFSVADSLKPEIFSKLNLKDRYYSVKKNGWRFIVLDGNDLSFHGSLTMEKKRSADSLYKELSARGLPICTNGTVD